MPHVCLIKNIYLNSAVLEGVEKYKTFFYHSINVNVKLFFKVNIKPLNVITYLYYNY